MYLILHGTDLQSGDIIHRIDIPLAVCQVAETGFPDPQSVELDAGKLVEETGSDIPQEHGIGLLGRCDQVRNVQRLKIVDEVSDRGLVDDCDIDRSHLTSLDRIDLSSELSVMVCLDLIFSFGLIVNPVCKCFHRLSDGSCL